MASKSRKKQDSAGYLHGYAAREQERLFKQARFLEQSVFQGIDYSLSNRLLEVGCGVGAQTEILLRRFPHLKITGVDRSPEQIATAKAITEKGRHAGRVRWVEADATKLPFAAKAFDASFVCWFLEHVSEPVRILKEVRRTLSRRAPIFCTEVMNASFFMEPYSPATLQYWMAFNDHQWNLKGDPFVGAKLGNYLIDAGFSDVETTIKTFHYDNRHPELRARMLGYWTELLLSGAPSLVEHRRVSRELVTEMTKELKAVAKARDAVFFYSYCQGRGLA